MPADNCIIHVIYAVKSTDINIDIFPNYNSHEKFSKEDNY